MNKKLAYELLKVFDTPRTVEVFQQYIDEELKKAFSQLKGYSDPTEIYRLQGKIAALEMLRKIREMSEQTIREVHADF